MPAGDLLDGDYQAELAGKLFKSGGTLSLVAPFVEGLGVPDVKSYDVDLEGQDGFYANTDRKGARLVTLHILIRSTAAGAWTALEGLQTTFDAAGDTELWFQMPTGRQFSLIGRPRGLDADLTNIEFGVIKCEGHFYCADPTITVGAGYDAVTKSWGFRTLPIGVPAGFSGGYIGRSGF